MDVTELHDEENLLLRQTLGMGCKQRSVKSLAQQLGTTQKAVQKKHIMSLATKPNNGIKNYGKIDYAQGYQPAIDYCKEHGYKWY